MAPWLGSPELKVGILVVAVSALVGTMALKVAEGPGILGGGKKFFFKADSANGLVPNSAVKMAGIKVGVIKDIVLEDGRARVIVALENKAQLTEGARVELKMDGILGDKHVELIPGDPNSAALKTDSELALAEGRGNGGMDEVMSDVSKMAKNLNALLEVLKKAATEGDESTPIGRIIRNIEGLTNNINDITGDNKDKVGEIVERVRNITKNVDTYINEESLARVDRSLRNIEDITNKIAKGEGTVGRLINDEQTVDELNSAITSVNKFLGGADKMETSVDFHSEFLTGPSQTKSFLGLKIQPGLDRYYELQVIDDPEGVKRSIVSKSSTNGGAENTYEETTTYKNKLKITALFAKNFWDFTIKGGLIENAGGVGVDYHLLDRKLRLSAEFYDFKEAQLRAFARYNFFKGIYLIAGGDNLLSQGDEDASAFVGGGIFITTDDLKLLASKMAF
jgi:phospholipid/cholesterol/gamma-HCH transport system substrate-binding protein